MLHFFFGFHGRVNRLKFFLGSLVTSLVSSMFGVHWMHSHHVRIYEDFDAWSMISGPDYTWSAGPGLVAVVGLIAAVVGVITHWATLALAAKRWHDLGATGWLALLSLIPGAGFVLFVILCLIPGNQGPNKYGADPRATGAPAVA